MRIGKTWAMWAACAAVALTSVVQAETVSTNDQIAQPLTLQAAPARKPLMWGLDQVGAAKPLDDWGINIGGYAEASWTYYADPAKSKLQPGRSFDAEHEDPTLNGVNVFAERTVDVTKQKFDVGGRIEWMWGGDSRFIHSTGLFDDDGVSEGPDEQFDLVQAYADVALPFGNGWRLRAGKFVTPFGYETINATTTPLYSRGLLFNYLLPLTHTGIVATYAVNDAWTFDLGVVRGWDDALEDKNDDGVTVIGRATWTLPDKMSVLYVGFSCGPEYAGDNTDLRTLIDVVYTRKLSDEWSIAAEADGLWETSDTPGVSSGDEAFAGGLGFWASYTFSKFVQVNGRAEYLYDGQGIRFNAPQSQNVYSVALGLTVTPFPDDNIGANLKIRPEVRYDYAENTVFGGDNQQLSAALEGYFTF